MFNYIQLKHKTTNINSNPETKKVPHGMQHCSVKFHEVMPSASTRHDSHVP